MNEVTDALHARLAADATFTSYLSTFGGAPAIFTGKAVPGTATKRYAVIRAPVLDDPFDAKDRSGREVLYDIGIYDAETGSRDAVEAAGKRARDLLHRHRLTVSGYDTLIASARGPFSAPAEPHIQGRIVSVRLVLRDTLD